MDFGNILGFAASEEEAKAAKEVFMSMLSLNEEEFGIISKAFLVEFARSFDNNELRRKTIESLNKDMAEKGMDFAEYRESVMKIIDDHCKTSSALKPYHKDFFKKLFSISFNVYEESMYNKDRKITVPIEIMLGGKAPTYATPNDAGADIYLPEDITLGPGERKIIPVKIKTAIPEGYTILIHPRSGLSAKTSLRIANCVAVIDSNYRGEYGVILENIEPPIKNIIYDFDEETHHPIIQAIEHGVSYSLSKGDRIAQMRIVAAPQINWQIVDSVDGIGEDRGGGFGHTGQ